MTELRHSNQRPFAFGLRFGLSLAILLAAGVCSLLFWQHFQQRAVLETTAGSLDEIRQARLDLAEGFLHWSLADTPDTPFSRDSALGRLRQAIRSFEQTLEAPGSLDKATVEPFRRDVLEFERQLLDWDPDDPARSRDLVQLRILYGDLERQAEQLDMAVRNTLIRLNRRSDHNFALTLGGSALSLILIIVILVLAIRRQHQTLAALKITEQELQNHRDHLEDLVAERTAELMTAREQAEAADRAKTAFLATMSHELRTPMNAVLGFCRLLRQRPLEAESGDLVRKIQVSADLLLNLIEDILDFSRIEANRIEIASSPFGLRRVLEDLAAIMETEARRKNLELEIAPRPEVDGLIGDERRLKQVLLKLLANAIKFTEQGRVEVRVDLESEDQPEVRLRFSVRDSGIGIAPAQQAAIFDAFNQADGSISRRFGGTGLGLAISRQLVHAMGGTLQVTSEPGRGSEFWFVLPFRRDPRPLSGVETPAPRDAPRLHGVRVLVVDDSEINRDLMQHVLEGMGAAVVLADDGQEALDWLDTHPRDVDLVLMDVQMPNMDGYTATRRIRTRPYGQGLPIIASTAGDVPAFREAARAAGMDDFIPKPFEVGPLLSLIEQHIRPSDRAVPAVDRRAPVASEPVSAESSDPACPVLDRALGIRQWGSPEVYQTYLEKFGLQYAETGDRLETLCRQGDFEVAAALAHKLAGAAGNLALPRLAALARRLESRLIAGETAAALDILPDLRLGIDAARAAIADSAPKRSEAPRQLPVSIMLADVPVRLKELLDALEQHDLGRAEDLLRQLREPLPDALRDIEKAVTDFDLSGAAALTRVVLQGLNSD
jgi:signal transduction histidine kinase/CheY-like chemotaxis protein/HPt (histidine-containing phosphotransfer) domain-containing protein